MKKYSDIKDIADLKQFTADAISLKKNPQAHKSLGKDLTLGMLFFNSSLRTRLSTQKAAQNLGMEVLTMNVGQDSWALEFENGKIMNSDKAEHVIEAAQVISQYCDIIAIRAFPKLQDKEEDYSELILNKFIEHATVPIVSMESATAHPLQALADLMTIEENKSKDKVKVVLSWAPHPRALPQAVPNSFAQFMQAAEDVELTICHPEGFELDEAFTKGAKVVHSQEQAFKDADFIYAKNWSSLQNYGQATDLHQDWTINKDKMDLTDEAYFMHCLPVRRNVVVSDDILDSDKSLVIEQANNRTYSAQQVLKTILEQINKA